MENIHERIKRLRKSMGMSQEKLATRCGYKDRSSISRIEKGEGDLTQTQIYTIASALNVTPVYLMDGEDLSHNKFGIKLKELRKKSNLSQAELSEAFNIPLDTLMSYENGTSEPDFNTAIFIADFFGVSLDDLISQGTINDYFEEINRDQLKQALFGTTKIEDEKLDEVLEYAKWVMLRDKNTF